MRRARLALWILPATLAAMAAGAASGPAPEEWSRGYSIGYQVGDDFRRQGLEMDPGLLLQGIRDALAGSEPLLTREEMDRALATLQQRAASAREQVREKERAFLARKARQEGVTALPSGLQYRVLRPGSGARPSPADTVTIHYRGTLVDGAEFDSSRSRGEPATFVVDYAIPGWREALQLMREGARWRIFLPPELGYGEKAPAQVGPDRALIFEIELASVEPRD